MLQLDESLIIGEGVDRTVYAHPDDSDLCIKIARCNFASEYQVQGVRDSLFFMLRKFDKNHFDYNYTDALYARRLQGKGQTDQYFRHLPECYGFIDTNLGRGVLWQRIRNYDGTDCPTLRDCYFSPELLGENDKEKLWSALNDFFAWQLRCCIMLREMAFANTLVCNIEDDKIRLYHVDAIGCVDLIPLANYSNLFAKMRILSKIRSFRKHMVKWLGEP